LLRTKWKKDQFKNKEMHLRKSLKLSGLLYAAQKRAQSRITKRSITNLMLDMLDLFRALIMNLSYFYNAMSLTLKQSRITNEV
jgi:hypothetical protein